MLRPKRKKKEFSFLLLFARFAMRAVAAHNILKRLFFCKALFCPPCLSAQHNIHHRSYIAGEVRVGRGR